MVLFAVTQLLSELKPIASFFSLVERPMGSQNVKPLLLCGLQAAGRKSAKRPRAGWRKKPTTRGESDPRHSKALSRFQKTLSHALSCFLKL